MHCFFFFNFCVIPNQFLRTIEFQATASISTLSALIILAKLKYNVSAIIQYKNKQVN